MTLDSFRHLVLSDSGVQGRLAAIEDPHAFAAACLALAAANGIALSEVDLGAALRPDPLGVARFEPVPPSPGWAPPGWLPIDIVPTATGPAVDWAHFGGIALADPFFAGSVRRAVSRPFHRMFRWQTGIGDFVRSAEPAPPPRGFVFHWSRCGSTLVSRMLATLPATRSISEAAPIDAAVRIGDAALLRAMAAALARDGSQSFLKLHCWHAFALPLFRRAFPATPWIFLHRDPLEILASHAASAAPEMTPQIMPPQMFGLDPGLPAGRDYEARVLARIAEAAIAGARLGGGLFVDYAALPAAVCAAILPHFGTRCGPREEAALGQASRADAKHPARSFSADRAFKREAAPAESREAAERHLAAVRRRLADLS
jgi:hypothetical protein